MATGRQDAEGYRLRARKAQCFCWERNGDALRVETRMLVVMSDYKKLKVWQSAHALALATYRTAVTIRGSQHAALRSQVIRASVSIPANIVEGRAKLGDKDFARFISYAIGSAAELEYHLGLCRDLRLIGENKATSLLKELTKVRRMLYALRRKLDGRDPPPPA